MKTKILILMLVLCLLLCACGNTASQDGSKDSSPTQNSGNSQSPTDGGSGNTEETAPSGTESAPTDPEVTLPEITLPGGFQGIELPPVIFDETNDDGVLTSRPVNQVTEPPIEEEPEETEATTPPVQSPSTGYSKGDLLPEDPLFDPEV